MWSQYLRSGITALITAPWAQYLWLGLITLFAAALRFYKLGEWSFWIDEIFTINHAMSHYSSAERIINNIPPATNWVPISVMLTAQVLNIGGINEWSARLCSAIIGTVTIPILYFPTRKIFDARVALIALLLLAVSPWHIFWSQNARFYTALLLFYSLALFVFYFAIERDRPLDFIGFYVLFYLAMSERMLAVLLLPVIVVYLLVVWILPFEKPPGFRPRNFLILSAPVLAFLLYELYLFATTGDFIFASDLEFLAPPIDTPVRLLILIAFNIGIPILCIAFFSGIYLCLRKERAGLFFLIAGFLPILLVAMANPFIFTVDRYVFMTLLFWLVLAANGLKVLFTIVNKPAILLAFGVLFIFLSGATFDNLLYYQINHGNRLEWQEAVDYVRVRMQAGDVVVSTRAPLASYYLGQDVLEYQDFLPADLEAIDAPIWFIIDHPGIWHGKLESKVWLEQHAQLMQYSQLRLPEENSLLIYRFETNHDENP
jgi:4-amino-4-deoxy-L-arabinose transferase-like glycosyltransferase